MTNLDSRRRYFAEEIQVIANLQSDALVDALATVPRERFLPPGPWMIRSESDFQSAPRHTADAEPQRVYHNVSVAIDSSRMLFNGAPSLLAMAIDALKLKAGGRVLHIGTGPGYYTALMARCVGPSGRVTGIEVDANLASTANGLLSEMSWVTVQEGTGAGPFDQQFDAILVNAGVTHPLAVWLDALAPGGRLMLPLTAGMPAMGPIGKGFLVLVERPTDDSPTWSARLVTMVAIYSAVGIRDDNLNMALGQAMQKQPFARLKSLRRDEHEPGASCWFHVPGACFSV